MLLAGCSASEENAVDIQEPAASVEQQESARQPAAVETAPSAPKIACTADSDCGERRIENAYCFQTNPVGTIYDWKCENPGTPESRCIETSKQGIVEECGELRFCSEGRCVKYANCTDTDGGLNFAVRGKVMTNDKMVYEDYCETDSLLIEYYCLPDHRAASKKERCDCDRGACIDGD